MRVATRSSRGARAAAALLVLALAVRCGETDAAAQCPTAEAEAQIDMDAYTRCTAVSGWALADPAPATRVTPSVFCGSADCQTFWNQMNALGYLRCFQDTKSDPYKLKQSSSGSDCFAAYGAAASTPATATSSPAAPATVTSSPASPTSSPASPTVTTATPSATTSPSSTSSTPSSDTTTTESPDGSPSSTAPSTTKTSTTTKKPTTGSGSTATNAEAETDGNAAGTGTGASSSTASKKTSTASGDGETDGTGDDGTDSAGTKSTTAASSSSSESAATGTTRSNTSNKKSAQSASGPGGDSASDSTDGDSSRPSSSTIVAGTSSGGLVVGLFVFFYIRRRKENSLAAKKLDGDDGRYLPTLQSSRSRASSAESFAVMGDTGFAGVVIQPKSGFWVDEDITAARIPFEKLKRGKLLSRGGYGEVYKGTYRDEVVAIKTLLPERRKDLRQIEKFLVEVKLMTALEHEYIVRFVGVAWDSLNELCVVSEYMARGDLRSLLAAYARDDFAHPRGFTPDKTKIALHVANALTYMHSLQPMVLHRDLKSRNILLDDELNAKVTDFGVSRERADTTMTVGVGSSLWIAPEVMTGGRYNDKADVFSFGVVLSELDTHELPYAHAVETGSSGRKLPDTVIVQMMTTGRLTVEFTDESESPIAQIGRRCVAVDPADRPSAAEVQHHIHQLWRGYVVSM